MEKKKKGWNVLKDEFSMNHMLSVKSESTIWQGQKENFPILLKRNKQKQHLTEYNKGHIMYVQFKNTIRYTTLTTKSNQNNNIWELVFF